MKSGLQLSYESFGSSKEYPLGHVQSGLLSDSRVHILLKPQVPLSVNAELATQILSGTDQIGVLIPLALEFFR